MQHNSTQSLFSRNVYQLVHKTTKENVSDNVDLEEMATNPGQSNFVVRPCRDRISIAEHYSRSYNSLPKVARKPIANQTETSQQSGHDEAAFDFDRFLITDSQKQRIGLETASDLKRQKIGLGDLHSHNVLNKIARRNPEP